MRRTKIIATVGPSSNSVSTIREMVSFGVDAIRLNFSHGTLEEKKEIILKIREASEKFEKYIPVIADLQGPVIRINIQKPIVIKKRDELEISLKPRNMKNDIKVNNQDFFRNVEINDILLVDDGKLVFKIIDKNTDSIRVLSQVDGVLYPKKKILIKGKEVVGKSLTDKDIDDLRFALENNVEYIALSMVKSREDLVLLKKYIDRFNGDPWVLAKIETPSGVENIKEIVEESDGVIVARGDLGQYYSLQHIPVLQKKIVYEGSRMGKITIVATQILESMRESETPTRAEITDIFNSVEEKVDAIMLTGETAIGKYPAEVAKWAASALEEADGEHSREIIFYEEDFEENIYDKFARGVIYISHILDGKIIGFTKKGNTARRLSRYRPKRDVFVATYDPRISNKINLLYAITPLLIKRRNDYWEILNEAKNNLKKRKLLRRGEIIVFTVGIRKESTDMLKVETI